MVCVTSDAILNREWLVAWQYYWPNVYEVPEIVETWRSLAKILTTADTVIPGHGPPIRITRKLLRELIDKFPRAEYGSRCPKVVGVLTQRLEKLR
jgi:glyoxylase-like metal-dependent hydrolase (beta-lactamase superfamily II)